jgi:acetyl esterase
VSIEAQRAGEYFTNRTGAHLVLRPGKPVAAKKDRLVPVEGGLITVRTYRPHGTGPFPLHVFLHGGGWCAGNLDQRDNRCQDLAADVACVVASVDYRLAPESQYPGPPDDAYRALIWLIEHAGELDVDPERVSIGGESAGGNLAAVVCLMARDRGGPRLAFQLLDVPATDLTMSQPSVTALGQGQYLMTAEGMRRYINMYLPDRALATEPYVSPLFAPDLTGLPPALVTTCEFDPLRDEGEAYGRRLQEAGVATIQVRLSGNIHASFSFTRLLPSAAAYHRTCVGALRRAHHLA